MIQVLLADDEAMIRAGVRAILAKDPGIEVVAEAADGHEAVQAVRRHRPDVALLDIQMPRLDGIAAAAQIHHELTGTAVLMLTTFGEDDFIARALQEGASGFLLKAGDPRELIAGVHAVAAGGAYLSRKVAERVIAGLRRGHTASEASRYPVGHLTEREHEVLALLGTGLSNAEIGARLHLVEGTVKAHVSAILGKLGVRNRVEAAIAAHEAGLTGRRD
ncbi:response regulator transcription factor [Streptomyces samsunensis]|uniref:Response regulator transcription factor n=1 Tax=Streptomyces malaysiensis TaxID=92644 RepID=A0ABX6WH94_STRMQ|nr:two component transcriptional regulator, LuxR family [Streptomyces malaysiensis]NUH44201.1 response regulator transcription factor [Streptomyces samsunensis]QPI59721.1 response regulator transcription factor [Streptomyces solisilvae]UHH21390.1 response regulator transcription factor [Streptomyces sp. HNM0561]MCQ6248114.1 response regulator transcription factor [Streptomyces malaysiensis]